MMRSDVYTPQSNAKRNKQVFSLCELTESLLVTSEGSRGFKGGGGERWGATAPNLPPDNFFSKSIVSSRVK